MPYVSKRRKKKRGISFSRKVQDTSLAVLAILTLGAVVWAFVPKNAPINPGVIPSVAPAVKRAAKPELSTALFIGDSYSAGQGAFTPSDKWTRIVSREMRWDEQNEALGGTGYVSTSDFEGCGLEECQNYLGIISTLKNLDPAAVFIAGGQNDFTVFARETAKTTAAIEKTFADYRKAFPNARIVAVGPSTPWEISDDVRAMDKAVRAAAMSVDADYVSLLDPNIIDPDHLVKDRVHVNSQGHAAIAERVLATLR